MVSMATGTPASQFQKEIMQLFSHGLLIRLCPVSPVGRKSFQRPRHLQNSCKCNNVHTGILFSTMKTEQCEHSWGRFSVKNNHCGSELTEVLLEWEALCAPWILRAPFVVLVEANIAGCIVFFRAGLTVYQCHYRLRCIHYYYIVFVLWVFLLKHTRLSTLSESVWSR